MKGSTRWSSITDTACAWCVEDTPRGACGSWLGSAAARWSPAARVRGMTLVAGDGIAYVEVCTRRRARPLGAESLPLAEAEWRKADSLVRAPLSSSLGALLGVRVPRGGTSVDWPLDSVGQSSEFKKKMRRTSRSPSSMWPAVAEAT